MRTLYLVLTLCIFLSCEKQPFNSTEDYLVFGHFFGECMGESCVLTYKLTSTALYQDTILDYSCTNNSFVQMSEQDFNQVSGLLESFPTNLLDESEDVLGCPDCLDQGGLHIEYSGSMGEGVWRIDQIQSAVPEYLHSFMDEVNASINILYN